MRQQTMVGLSLGLMLFLTGCNTQAATNNVATSSPSANQTANSSVSKKPVAKSDPWPDVGWVLTNALMKQKKWRTEYNINLSINNGVYGKTAGYWHWQLPSHWKPYLFKNEYYIFPKSGPMYLNHKTLFITMQGTVFLKFGVAGRYWDPLSEADIPPNATIVAEFVPIKPAVKAGIMPVYHSQPQVNIAQPAVLKILGLTPSQYHKEIGTASESHYHKDSGNAGSKK